MTTQSAKPILLRALCGLQVLVILLLQASNVSVAYTFDEHRALFDHTTPNDIVAGTLPFSADAIQDSVLSFAVSSDDDIKYPIKVFTMTQGAAICRLAGYLDNCKHPFTEHGGTPGYTDILPPYAVDFVVTNDYMEPSPTKPADLQHFPLFVTGIVPIFNIPGINQLILTKLTLARIFRGCDTIDPECRPGSITEWNDTAIKDTNPEWMHPFLDAAGPIKLVMRGDTSGSTYWMKKALARFDPEFALQIPVPTNSRNWTGVNIHVHKSAPEAILEYIAETPGTIAYVLSNFAETAQVAKVALAIDDDATIVVEASSSSLASTIGDVGLAFGNDGRNASELTVDLTLARGSKAWPLSSFAYLVTRVNKTGDNCTAKMNDLLSFLEHFYVNGSAQARQSGAFSRYYALFPDDAAKEVLDRVRSSLRCNGELVYKFPPPPARVVVFTEQVMQGSMEILAKGFEEDHNGAVIVDIRTSQSRREIVNHFLEENTGYIVLADENLSSDLMADDKVMNNLELMALPYAVSSSSFIYNLCAIGDTACTLNDFELVVDIHTAALILDGVITLWNDSRIAELNPSVILPAAPIVIFLGPRTTDFHFDFIELIRRDFLVDFSFGAPEAIVRRTYADVIRAVSVHPYSFSYVPLNGSSEDGIREAKVKTLSTGDAITNTIASIEACSTDTYDVQTHAFVISASKAPGCYPLLDAVSLVTKRVYTTTSETSRQVAIATARLVEFIMRKSIRQDSTATTILTSSRFGTLCDYKDGDRVNVATINMEMVKSITVDGEQVLVVPHNMNWIPVALEGVMYAIMILELTAFVGLAVWVIVHRNRKLVRNSSPTFMLLVLFGATMMSLTVIPLAAQDSFLDPVGVPLEDLNPSIPFLTSACIAQPFLFSVGFFIVFSALFLKSWRLIRIFNNTKLKNLFLRDRQLLIYQTAMMLLVVCLNLIWALYSPMEWHRFPAFIDRELNLVVDSSGLCHSPEGVYPALPLVAGILLMLAVGNYLAYLGRRIPTEFNESKWTAMAMVVALESLAMGVPVMIMANEQPIAGFVVKASICLLISGATVGLIFVPKVAMAYGWGVMEGESNPWRFVKPGSSGSNNHKDENSSKNGGTGIDDHRNSKKAVGISPSLNSLVSGKVMVTTDNPSFSAKPNPFKLSPSLSGKNNARPPSSVQLKTVLDSDPTRRRFRRYLQTLKMDENVRFWDSVTVCRNEVTPEKRATSARAIMQTFVLDTAPFQVNLSSRVREQLVDAFKKNDKERLGDIDFFQTASDELFQDLRQSDAFRIFMENDTFSTANLSHSDPNAVDTGSKKS